MYKTTPVISYPSHEAGDSIACDVFVYGSTPGGIAAAVEAARGGLQVVLACPKKNLGGMAASGLCTTDVVRRHLWGGFVTEFIQKTYEHYERHLGKDHHDWSLCQEGWYYEPSVAEAVFNDIVNAEANIRWIPDSWLQSVSVCSNIIKSVTISAAKHSALAIFAHTFVDGTYEGDLAAAAGVPYRVGRESRDEYGESLAGIHYMDWTTGREIKTPMSGEASLAIQAYCARCVITDDPTHRIPIEKPPTYEEHLPDYLPVLDDFKLGRITEINQVFWGERLPRGKIQVNGHIESLTSINCPGLSWGYPEAGRYLREELDRFHIEHAWGLLWFLQHDPHVPEAIAKLARTVGLHDQEFTGNGHWPWQIYVRQGRRIEGREIVTQHNFCVNKRTGRTPQVDGAIALAEHSFDVHPCHDRRLSRHGFMEGVLWYPQKAHGPAQPGQIPYGALLPRKLDNMAVPVALSSTHIAMSVVRMEPVWMITGQVAGRAAVIAKETHRTIAQIDPSELNHQWTKPCTADLLIENV